MKNLYFLLTALFLFSCQNEENTVNQNNDAALTKTSPLASLVLRVSQQPTHWDNLLDNSDCYSVQLPVGITLNGQNLIVASESDFANAQQNMDNSWSDDDIVHFHFPITIVFRDFQQQIINSQAQLNAVTCEGDNFNEIRCLDFAYPININTYNTNNHVANTVTIDSDSELYNVIDQLTNSEIFTIVYPVTLSLLSGGEVIVSTNNGLEATIESAIGNCNSGPGPAPTGLEAIITSGTWHISYCEDDSSGSGSGEAVDYYDGYVFTFNMNGSVSAVKNSIVNNGTWNVYQDGSHKMIDLFFPSQALQGLTNDEWRVTEYNQSNFRLKNDQSGSWGGHEYVYFTKN